MGLFIHSGQETQIAIYPQVTYTTNDAIGKLNHCYYYIVGLLKHRANVTFAKLSPASF